MYNWIYKVLLSVTSQVLREKGKGLKSQETRGEFNIGTSISKRLKEVKKPLKFGY